MNEEIGILKKQFLDIKQLQSMIAGNFVKLIADTSIPLEERWALFCDAPDDFSKTNGWIEYFDALKSHEWCTDYEVYHWERREHQHIVSFVERVYDVLDYKGRDKHSLDDPQINALIIELQEEILRKNIKSFIWDW